MLTEDELYYWSLLIEPSKKFKLEQVTSFLEQKLLEREHDREEWLHYHLNECSINKMKN